MTFQGGLRGRFLTRGQILQANVRVVVPILDGANGRPLPLNVALALFRWGTAQRIEYAHLCRFKRVALQENTMRAMRGTPFLDVAGRLGATGSRAIWSKGGESG